MLLQSDLRGGCLDDVLPRHAEGVRKNGPQALVARHQIAERPFQRRDVERTREANGHGDRVDGAAALDPVQEPQSPLRERQQNLGRARDRAQGRARRFTFGETADQRLDGRGFEQAANRKLDIEAGADAADQPRRQQRMAAEREEVVIDADPFEPQHVGKQPAQRSLRAACAGRAASRRVPRVPARPAGRACRWSSEAARPAPRRPTAPCSPAGPAPDVRATPTDRAADRDRRRRRLRAACRPARPRARSPRPAIRRHGATSTASISPGSIRNPRIFTWSSARPRRSSSPSRRQRARSPVRYIRLPGEPKGSATNRSAVSPGRRTYPRASPAPAT